MHTIFTVGAHIMTRGNFFSAKIFGVLQKRFEFDLTVTKDIR